MTKHRARPKNDHEFWPAGRCPPPCGKLRHKSRRAARKWLKNRPHDNGHNDIYRCHNDEQWWHLGRLAPVVITGDKTRDQAYAWRKPSPEGAPPMSTSTPVRTPSDPREFTTPGDRTTGQLDILMNDLTTYRFVPQVAVTPALARRILDLNADNQRTKKDRKIAVFARDMGRDRWREKTGQVIQIGTDGKMLNGQNRMHAVIQSGATIRFDICFGVDPKDMTVIDAHTPRTAADAIRVAGGGDLSHVTPIVKHILAWEAGYPKGPSGSQQASYLEINDRYLADAKLFEAAAARGVDCGRRQVGTPAALGTAYFALVKAADNKEAVDDLFDQLVSGVYPVSDPVGMGWGPYRLREKLIGYRRDRLTRADIIAMTVRVWNRHNTLVDGKREAVERVQAVRSIDGEGLTNANFPRPKKALSL